jgi:hypothetical protein
MEMNQFLTLFADSVDRLNQQVPAFENQGNQYKPGIGPYGEDNIVDLVINDIVSGTMPSNIHIRPGAPVRRELGLNNYVGVNGRAATPDLVVDNNLIEFKICRPLRDNGEREDTWFKKVFEPNPQSYSTFLDVIKLCRFRDQYDPERKWNPWVVVIGFERQNETDYILDQYFPDLYGHISTNMVQLPYRHFLSFTRDMGTRHPYHQVLKLYGFGY